MDFDEFSDVSLDNSDTNDLTVCSGESRRNGDDAGTSIHREGSSLKQLSVDSSGVDGDMMDAETESGTASNHVNDGLREYDPLNDQTFDVFDDFPQTEEYVSSSAYYKNNQSSFSELNGGDRLPSEDRSGGSHMLPFVDEDLLVRRKRFGSESVSDGSTSTICTDDTLEQDLQLHAPLYKQASRSSIDELLFELYDKHSSKVLFNNPLPWLRMNCVVQRGFCGIGGSQRHSVCSSIDGSSTDCSSLSEYQLVRSESDSMRHTASSLQMKGILSHRNNRPHTVFPPLQIT